MEEGELYKCHFQNELVPISNILSFYCQFYGHRNVTVLDGGFPKWIKDGYSNSTEIPQVQVKLMRGSRKFVRGGLTLTTFIFFNLMRGGRDQVPL